MQERFLAFSMLKGHLSTNHGSNDLCDECYAHGHQRQHCSGIRTSCFEKTLLATRDCSNVANIGVFQRSS